MVYHGGLATTLNELAQHSRVGMKLHESAIPIKLELKAVCELLVLDPLYVANEGKLICICPQADEQKLLATIHANPHGKEAPIIGEVIADANHMVQMETSFGGSRIVD